MLLAISQNRVTHGLYLGGLTALDPTRTTDHRGVTLLFGQAAPYTVDLMRPQRERQAVTPDLAPRADSLRLRHLG